MPACWTRDFRVYRFLTMRTSSRCRHRTGLREAVQLDGCLLSLQGKYSSSFSFCLKTDYLPSPVFGQPRSRLWQKDADIRVYFGSKKVPLVLHSKGLVETTSRKGLCLPRDVAG